MSAMFFVPCGEWQSRQFVDQEPSSLPVVSLVCPLCAWQSEQSWLELSRTSRRPSPLRAAAAVTGTAFESTSAALALETFARSVYAPAVGASRTS